LNLRRRVNDSLFSLQNQILAHNTSARIIWSNQSLVLQSVTRSSAGRYLCAATNALNETRSEPLHFRVKCKSKLPFTATIENDWKWRSGILRVGPRREAADLRFVLYDY